MTFVIKTRGTPSPVIAAEYYCDEHHRFDLDVQRNAAGDAPDEQPCPDCGAAAILCISAPFGKVRAIEAVKGGWAKPERPTWTDTRNIGDGQALYDWHDDRAKVWERKRQEDVVKFAREHNERVRSDD